jgi:hypothetical protein
MKHYAVFPSATVEKANSTVSAWNAKGYKTLVYLDTPEMRCNADVVSYGARATFPGYYRVINDLVWLAFANGADVVTCIGDDMLPPDQGAEWVSTDYFKRFPNGLGVYQGCGDLQGMDGNGVPAAARICGSPTFGVEWANRAYQGAGPFADIYSSFYADEDLYNVASKLGLLVMEYSVRIFHKHWSWGHAQREGYHDRAALNWERDKAIFMTRKAAGFPGSDLL